MAKVTGQQIIAKAKEFLGQSGKRFWKDYGCPEGWPYCVIFVWDIFRMCGASELFCGGQKVAGCGVEKAWLDKNCKKVPLTQAQQGDIVMFSWRAGEISHTGFAIKPLSSSVLQTIEGNTNGGVVAIRQRAAANILGIYRPKYASATPSNAGGSKRIVIDKTYRVIGKAGSNIRVLPSTGATIIGGLSYNSTFHATRKEGNWVFDADRKGWVCLTDGRNNFLAEVTAYRQKWIVVSSIGCNIRAGAGTSYKKCGAIPKGKTFVATKKSGYWVYAPALNGWICTGNGREIWCKPA